MNTSSPIIVTATLLFATLAFTGITHAQNPTGIMAAQQSLRSNPLLQLSDREYEIFQLLAQGKTTADIGEELILAKTTVSTYRRRILDKLEVENLAELMDLATKYGG